MMRSVALIFAVGTGRALTSPTWQTLQPELVSPAERPQAISLGAVNQNLARAVGPAIGGILLAVTNVGTVFLINAATFAAVIAVLAAWHSTRAPDALPREHGGEAVRAGGRYVAASPRASGRCSKRGVLANLAVASFAHLVQVIRHGLKKIQYRPGLIEGCLPGTGLIMEPGETPVDIMS
jgi:MFS family permease